MASRGRRGSSSSRGDDAGTTLSQEEAEGSGGGLSSTGGDGRELSANTYAACKLSSQFGWYTTVALALLVAAAVLILPAVDGVVRTTMIDRGERGHHHFWWTASRTAALQAPSGTGVRHHWETQGIPSAEGAQGAADQGQSRSQTNLEVNQSEGLGGEFGLFSDWRLALRERGDLRGEGCMTEGRRGEVREVLEKRRATPHRKKVAMCVRTKDFARYLPEWIAFHYAVGVDEISLYDDDSADNTTEVIKPFVDAGIVRYFYEPIPKRRFQMKPLNLCLARYIEEKDSGDSNAPSWLLFHDTDEYIYPEDTSLTILQALEKHNHTCCALVPRVQYGTSGYETMPRGLVEEVFLAHECSKSDPVNPKVMVNLDPTDKDHPVSPHLKSMHKAKGCVCADHQHSNMRINHYLGSRGDYIDRLKRYWTDGFKVENGAETRLADRDTNDCRSYDVIHWACATREILYRVVNGLDLEPT
ncbi:unnamed protein product [Pylaiella littoralis]